MGTAFNVFSTVAVGLLQLVAFASIGLVIGLAWRRLRGRRVASPKARKRSYMVVVAVSVPLAAVAVALLLYLMTRAGAPAPGKPYFLRTVNITYESKNRAWVCRDLVELRLDICRPSSHVEPPSGWSPTGEHPNDLGWSMITSRRLVASDPAGRLVYPEQIPLPPVPLPPAAQGCLANSLLVPIPAVVVLRVPKHLVRAVDPPIRSARPLPAGFEELELVRLATDNVTVEITHPWLRNEVGDTVLAWNVWRGVNWLILAVVAMFADRVKGFLQHLFGRTEKPQRRGDAGFRPPPR